ncbi:aldehyde dehydrogenase family protein [Amycolatopsis acidicola]|uniref:aldehyde dehydrogenase family protein n=1 Tax=Amycolatopsis acidicola TaxID=2596893 RepID=UPI001FB6A179|nr:aldehyde dehydrogenase family protein [Amycolatopsis acidicola]
MHSAPPAGQGRSVDPASPGRIVHAFRPATAADVHTAVDEAQEAACAWASTPPLRRATVLTRIADQLERHRDELATLITAEEGKPLGAARGEVGKSAEQFRLAAQLAYLVEGTTFPDESAGVFAYTLRAPLGVMAAITPWNFPLSLAARKIAPALAAGNAVVFKPSPVTAGTGERLAGIAVEAGLPAALLPVIQGQDAAAMTALLQDARIRGISFTGSDATGARLRAEAHGQARLQLELGGHNAAVVCADADLAKAAADIATGAFGLTGQACTSTDRVLVAEPVLAEFTDLLAAKVEALRVGPGDRDGVTTGPVATAAQYERLNELKESAVAAGAKTVAEAGFADGRDPAGYWVAPTLFAQVPAGHGLVSGEVFGPYCSVIPVAGPEEALALINASAHGLVAGVHTADLTTAHHFAARARCGVVKVNAPTTGNGVAPPFGGWKASSGGGFPEGGRQALDFVTETKTVYLTHGAN